MSKTFVASLSIVLGTLGATGLAHAQAADGPSYPALAPIQSTATRVEVQSAAASAAHAGVASSHLRALPDGGVDPAMQAVFASQRRPLAVRSEAHAAAQLPSVIISDDRYGS